MSNSQRTSPKNLSAAVAAAAAQRSSALRATAHTDPRLLNIRGGLIRTHRALLRIDFTTWRLLSMLLIPALLSSAVYLAWPFIDMLWTAIINFWVGLLGPDISLARHEVEMGGMFHIPYPLVQAALPTATQWWSGLALAGVLLIGPTFMPPKMLPLVYMLRFIGALQVAIQIYFYFWGMHFPHTAGGSVASMMQSSFALMLIAPWLYGLTYNIFDFSLSRKFALPLMALGYLAVLTPVQFILAAVLMQQFSLLWHPLLYLLGTTLLQFTMLLALYAWAMSWNRADNAA
ncbi:MULTISPECIES: hypothetical protein [unclassified Herbaspirillum]|uniref:hypothetical protein n=1 Tax=unclassified Herbaspirillum TaxID=2624150 RepID=UPI001F3346A8|nr:MULTISPECIES: hypothetical protein [unclassified Herbaspirillum]